MSIFLGQLGRLVELKCPADQQVAAEDRFTFQTTLEGRVKSQARPVGRRSWSLSTSDATTPAEQAGLLSFAGGEWGPGPFVFVSADAPVTNMLSPAASLCDPLEVPIGRALITATPPMQLPDGSWAGRSILKATGRLYIGAEATPVLPGREVTVSAVVKGVGAAVIINWRDIAGNSIASTASKVEATGSSPVRSWITAAPPENATSCRIAVNDATTQACHPAITWTGEPFDWAAGEGCPKSVIHSMSKNLTLASADPRGGRYASLSFTVTEVG